MHPLDLYLQFASVFTLDILLFAHMLILQDLMSLNVKCYLKYKVNIVFHLTSMKCQNFAKFALLCTYSDNQGMKENIDK